MKGSIEVVCGPMFSGKTEELIKRINRAKYARRRTMIFKPKIDDRYSADAIQSHDGNNVPATVVENSTHLEVAVRNFRAAHSGELPEVVGVEEVQFFDDQIIQTLYDLKCQGVRVIVAGLDIDWKGVPFSVTATLLALADKVDKQTAVCMVCGEDATYSYLRNKNGEQIQVGAAEKYEARCFQHWAE